MQSKDFFLTTDSETTDWLTPVFILLISEILKLSVWLPYLAEKMILFYLFFKNLSRIGNAEI